MDSESLAAGTPGHPGGAAGPRPVTASDSESEPMAQPGMPRGLRCKTDSEFENSLPRESAANLNRRMSSARRAPSRSGAAEGWGVRKRGRYSDSEPGKGPLRLGG